MLIDIRDENASNSRRNDALFTRRNIANTAIWAFKNSMCQENVLASQVSYMDWYCDACQQVYKCTNGALLEEDVNNQNQPDCST